jgi:hypothetical protein
MVCFFYKLTELKKLKSLKILIFNFFKDLLTQCVFVANLIHLQITQIYIQYHNGLSTYRDYGSKIKLLTRKY